MRTFIASTLLILLTQVLSAQQERVYVQVYPDSVVIFNTGAEENCAARFEITVTVQGGIVTMTETDTVKMKANCICFFDLSSTLTGLTAGSYTVNVYREYLKKYGYGQDTILFIGSAEFFIPDLGGPPQVARLHQTDCYWPTNVSRIPDQDAFLSLETYPNPASPSTIIRYSLRNADRVVITIHDAKGGEIATLIKGMQPPGNHEFVVENRIFPRSGVYFCTLEAGISRKTVKMIVVR